MRAEAAISNPLDLDVLLRGEANTLAQFESRRLAFHFVVIVAAGYYVGAVIHLVVSVRLLGCFDRWLIKPAQPTETSGIKTKGAI